jgi:hypothetical protein
MAPTRLPSVEIMANPSNVEEAHSPAVDCNGL